MGGTCTQVGDYLLPDVEAPESPQIGMSCSSKSNRQGGVDMDDITQQLKAYIDGLQTGAHLINELYK